MRNQAGPIFHLQARAQKEFCPSLANTLPTHRPAHAKQHCPDPPKVSPPRTKHSIFPLKKRQPKRPPWRKRAGDVNISSRPLLCCSAPSFDARSARSQVMLPSTSVQGQVLQSYSLELTKISACGAPGNSRCPTCPAPENRCGQGKKSVPQTHFVREPVA